MCLILWQVYRIVKRRSSWCILKRDVLLYVENKMQVAAACKECRRAQRHEFSNDCQWTAETELVKYVQRQTFSPDILSLTVSGCVKNSSSLRHLDPIILPKQSEEGWRDRLSQSIVMSHCHEMSVHSGREYVLLQLQRKYWIVGARAAMRHILKNCAFCRRYNVTPLQQKMSDLPRCTVTADNPPFTWVGVDLFGPFDVKQNRSVKKRYGVVFVCLAIKAVHIKIVHSMDTESFLNALQRFMCRRGKPSEIWSDNGTNLVGANRELRNSMNEWNQQKVSNFLRKTIDDIEFFFIKSRSLLIK